MPNFDALRSAISGPLSYLCKPQKPAELLLCCPFQQSIEDISRYNNTTLIGNGPYYERGSLAYYDINNPFPFSASLSRALDLSAPWTVEYYLVAHNGDYSNAIVTLGGIEWSVGCNDTSFSFYQQGLKYNGTMVYNLGARTGTTSFYSLTYSNGVVSLYRDSVLITSASQTFSGSVFNMTIANGSSRNWGDYPPGISNLRLYQKRGTPSVPTAPYTGFEPL